MEEKKQRAQWGSKIGFILAAAGSAVGLGNIWKFPGKAYAGGGGAFILIYIAIVVLIGVPVMLSELCIGRKAQANAVGAFQRLDKRFTWVGYIAIIVPLIITSYYVHVGGWVLRYIVGYITDVESIYADPLGYFYGLLGYSAETGETWFPTAAIVFAAIFMAANIFIIMKGVKGGIEKFNKIGMPALFVILFVLLVRSVTLPGAGEGLKYMLTADWSKVTFSTVLVALGQAFFSLSLGMGIMITYGSYLNEKEDLARSSLVICGCDTLVALIAGFIIVPAVFATLGEEGVGKGAGFAFTSLAGVFQAMPGGRFFGILFYLLLLFAALTSSISLMEAVIAYLTEQFGWERKKTTLFTGIGMFLFGSLYTLSQAAYNIKGIWFDFANGLSFPILGDAIEYLHDCLLIPLCALGVSIFVGWVWKPKTAIEEVRRSEGVKFGWAGAFSVLVKYVAPIAILSIIAASFVTGTILS